MFTAQHRLPFPDNLPRIGRRDPACILGYVSGCTYIDKHKETQQQYFVVAGTNRIVQFLTVEPPHTCVFLFESTEKILSIEASRNVFVTRELMPGGDIVVFCYQLVRGSTDIASAASHVSCVALSERMSTVAVYRTLLPLSNHLDLKVPDDVAPYRHITALAVCPYTRTLIVAIDDAVLVYQWSDAEKVETNYAPWKLFYTMHMPFIVCHLAISRATVVVASSAAVMVLEIHNEQDGARAMECVFATDGTALPHVQATMDLLPSHAVDYEEVAEQKGQPDQHGHLEYEFALDASLTSRTNVVRISLAVASSNKSADEKPWLITLLARSFSKLDRVAAVQIIEETCSVFVSTDTHGYLYFIADSSVPSGEARCNLVAAYAYSSLFLSATTDGSFLYVSTQTGMEVFGLWTAQPWTHGLQRAPTLLYRVPMPPVALLLSASHTPVVETVPIFDCASLLCLPPIPSETATNMMYERSLPAVEFELRGDPAQIPLEDAPAYAMSIWQRATTANVFKELLATSVTDRPNVLLEAHVLLAARVFAQQACNFSGTSAIAQLVMKTQRDAYVQLLQTTYGRLAIECEEAGRPVLAVGAHLCSHAPLSKLVPLLTSRIGIAAEHASTAFIISCLLPPESSAYVTRTCPLLTSCRIERHAETQSNPEVAKAMWSFLFKHVYISGDASRVASVHDTTGLLEIAGLSVAAQLSDLILESNVLLWGQDLLPWADVQSWLAQQTPTADIDASVHALCNWLVAAATAKTSDAVPDPPLSLLVANHVNTYILKHISMLTSSLSDHLWSLLVCHFPLVCCNVLCALIRSETITLEHDLLPALSDEETEKKKVNKACLPHFLSILRKHGLDVTSSVLTRAVCSHVLNACLTQHGNDQGPALVLSEADATCLTGSLFRAILMHVPIIADENALGDGTTKMSMWRSKWIVSSTSVVLTTPSLSPQSSIAANLLYDVLMTPDNLDLAICSRIEFQEWYRISTCGLHVKWDDISGNDLSIDQQMVLSLLTMPGSFKGVTNAVKLFLANVAGTDGKAAYQLQDLITYCECVCGMFGSRSKGQDWCDVCDVLLNSMTESRENKNPAQAKAYLKFYRVALGYVAQLVDAQTMIEWLPVNGNVSFYTPYIERVLQKC